MINKFLEIIVTAYSDFMSKPLVFLLVCLITFSAFVFKVDETMLNVAISVFTMIVGLAVLVSTKRDSIALHLKIDKLIKASNMTNEAIGAEHETTDDLEREKKIVEQEK